jgi:sec-independent protein translocase protein TatA
MFGLSPMELMIVGGIALLLFGSRLPEVARGLGKSVIEFKKGLNGIQDEITGTATPQSYTPPRASRVREDREEPAAPKFEPPVEAT